MALALAPKKYPYNVVGVLEVPYEEGGVQKKWVGSGYLLKTAAYPDRRDIVLTAAHNLVFLRRGTRQEVRFTLDGDSDVYTLASREDGTLRYAIPQHYDERPNNPAFGYAVMVLQKGAGGSHPPLTLTLAGDTLRTTATLAGALSARVDEGDHRVYRSAVTAKMQTTSPLHFPLHATAPGMCGGPVLVQGRSAWTSMGIVTGTGEVDGTLRGIAAPIFEEAARHIDTLIAMALDG
ncbi:hypothetical protein JY651_17580 [Pyxidicoccus parkwayensis]|uniref:Serine protease n=1 Tax=Pyxidicoccus parkwayensis TaxID=2813578 RepID=A0ABX7P848_9BACT|nr:hypothetical protein [Pyxidicoccus parkwaysis]QSQ26630.1 hypothetical protein JY651_17580 [Pyxidicoccus parkwaysis]